MDTPTPGLSNRGLVYSLSVRPMYTSDVENRQHRSMLEHRRRQIADIDFVKNSKQHVMT